MKRARSHWFGLLLSMVSLPVPAVAVHFWVNGDGVTHFSDTLPVDEDLAITTVELAVKFPPPVDAAADYYSIANQWQRLCEEREASTRLSLGKARVRAQEAAAAADNESPPEYATDRRYSIDSRGYPLFAPLLYGYDRTYGHRPSRHGHPGGAHRGPPRGEIAWRTRDWLHGAVGSRGGHRHGNGGGAGSSAGFNLR